MLKALCKAGVGGGRGRNVMLVGFVACKHVRCKRGAKGAGVLRVVCDCIWITSQPVHVSPFPMISHPFH